MNIVLEYIKYRLNAKGRHGIHSPFIYDMVDKCFRTSINTEDKQKIKSLIHSLKNDQRSLTIQDFGAGSKKLGATRKVSQLLRTSSSKGKFGKLFYQIAKHYQPESILEFGTSIGIGSIHFALGNKNTQLLTIEACSETFTIAQENFAKMDLENVDGVNATFDTFLSSQPTNKYDILFIDGHHDGTALLNYLDSLKTNIHDETLIIIDDIRWSQSMFDAWTSLKNSDEFHVSIDLFRMGIISPRPFQEKEHFILKY